MGSKPKISSSAAAVRRFRRRSPTKSRKTPYGGHRRSARHICGASVSDKLEALRELVPTQNSEINTDRLFEDTADYIIRLKTQVFLLQRLIELYGSEPQENRDGV